jgi:hypothetical protein
MDRRRRRRRRRRSKQRGVIEESDRGDTATSIYQPSFEVWRLSVTAYEHSSACGSFVRQRQHGQDRGE